MKRLFPLFLAVVPIVSMAQQPEPDYQLQACGNQLMQQVGDSLQAHTQILQLQDEVKKLQAEVDAHKVKAKSKGNKK
jgi:hypothetical protein